MNRLLHCQIAIDNSADGNGHGRCLCLSPFSCRINTEMNLCKTLLRRLAGVLEPDLADVAKAFTTLLEADPVLHQPGLRISAHADAESGQIRIPLDVIGLVGGPLERRQR
jgi:hypothetical protein